MKSKIESLLFIAGKPIGVNECARLFGVEKNLVRESFEELMADYEKTDRGMRLVTVAHGDSVRYQMVTNPDSADFVKRFTKQELTGELTRPAAETLAIIAYRGPISKPELEKIRGVNCALIIRNLMIRGLIEEEKRVDDCVLTYMVTHEFLAWLGISNVISLPNYDVLHNEILPDTEDK